MAGTEYEFPAAGIDAGRYVTVLQAELRAIASRLVMPEFMLTSDASNANYSLDDGGRGAGGQDVRAASARHARRRPGVALARGAARGGGRPSAGRSADAPWRFAAFRPRWPCATG